MSDRRFHAPSQISPLAPAVFPQILDYKTLAAGVYWAALPLAMAPKFERGDPLSPVPFGSPLLVRLVGDSPCMSMRLVEYPQWKIDASRIVRGMAWLARVDEPVYAEREVGKQQKNNS